MVEGDEEPEPLSMAIKAGHGQLSHFTLESGPAAREPEPLSRAVKAGALFPDSTTETDIAEDNEPEPLTMAIKAGRKPLQVQLQPKYDSDDEPEPLSMSKKAGRSIPAQAVIGAPHNLPSPFSAGKHVGAQHDSAIEMHDKAAVQSADFNGSVSVPASEAEAPQELMSRAKSGVHVHVTADADAAGEGGNVAGEEDGWEDEPEPLTRAVKAGAGRPAVVPYTEPPERIAEPVPGGSPVTPPGRGEHGKLIS